MGRGTPEIRYAEIERETRNCRIQIVLDLDGGSRQDVATGLAFFDEMLSVFALHADLNLGVKVEGAFAAGDHHILEDVGVAIGQAIRESLRDTDPIVRFASNHTPMDDALVLTVVDFGGRGWLEFDCHFRRDQIGDVATENVKSFFRALCVHGGATVHFRKEAGDNDQHVVEAMFKGFGRAVHSATRRIELRQGK